MKIAVVGHCQVRGIAKSLSAICKDAICTSFHVTVPLLKANKARLFEFGDYDYVFMNIFPHSNWKYLHFEQCKNINNVIFIPLVRFSGSHPDCIYFKKISNESIKSPIGDYHSFIVANSYLSGMSIEECFKLFNPDFYRFLGYDKAYANGIEFLRNSLNDQGVDGDFLVQKWASKGHFMHTINHPKLFVLEDIAKSLCELKNVPYDKNLNVTDFVVDDLMVNTQFPIYPGLGNHSCESESLNFKVSQVLTEAPIANVRLLNLKQFIEGSYQLYKTYGSINGCVPEVGRLRFESAIESYKGVEKSSFKHPYKKLPEYNYWSRAITKKKPGDVDPVVSFDFKISAHAKVATAGSCFAQHIARTLANSGMNYYVSETGPENISSDKKNELGYGLFSARYGNIYTSRQLLQLINRAYGNFHPTQTHWCTEDGFFIDPFRPNIGERFHSLDELKADSDSHLFYVREMFENLDVFIFTLGLTEAWENISDGAVYPVAPGVISCNKDNNQYRFVNFECEEVISDLEKFISKLRTVNPNAKIILTVSPVPLVATMEDRHVLTSTTLSKSILRVAADKLSRSFTFVSYFPSYEVITGNFNRGSYFGSDLRSVLDSGVDHVMRLFMEHATDVGMSDGVLVEHTKKEYLVDENLEKEMEELSKVICDEDLLVQ